MCHAIAYFDNPTTTHTRESLTEQFDRRDSHPTHHAVVGRDGGGTIVAYAWNVISPPDQTSPEVWIQMGVHPAWRYHQIGVKLANWTIGRALTWYRHILTRREGLGPLCIYVVADENSRVADDFLADGRLAITRWFYDGHRDLDTPIDDAPVLDDIDIVPFSPDYSADVRRVHNLAFAADDSFSEVLPIEWEQSLDRPDFRADWSWVARDRATGQIVGHALNSQTESNGIIQGWTERIGVDPAYQGRGIGKALMIASMRSFQESGVTIAGVGVDTTDPDIATQLFTKLGYHLDDRVVLFEQCFTG